MGFQWKSIVKDIAPVLGTALGGPLAGTAIKVLAEGILGEELTGEPSAALEKRLEKAVQNATPDQLLKLKDIEQSFTVKMEELGVDVFRIEKEDRDSARKAHKDSKMPAIIWGSTTAIITGFAAALFRFDLPVENASIIYMILGQMVTLWVGAGAYYVGTTRGSSDKNKMLGAIK